MAAHFNNQGFYSPIPKFNYHKELSEKEIDQKIWISLVEKHKLEKHMKKKEYNKLIQKINSSNMPSFDLRSEGH